MKGLHDTESSINHDFQDSKVLVSLGLKSA